MKNKTNFKGGPSIRFDTKIHTNQIRAYLPLLNSKAIDLINDSQERTDSVIPVYGGQYSNYYHFDNNKLSESTAKINEGYRGALAAFESQPEEILSILAGLPMPFRISIPIATGMNYLSGDLWGTSVFSMKDLDSLRSSAR